MYKLGRDGAYHTVVTPSGVVQFRSLNRQRCRDWITDNTPQA